MVPTTMDLCNRAIVRRLDRIIGLLEVIAVQQGVEIVTIADDFAKLTAEVAQDVTVEAGAVTAIQGIEAHLAALASANTISPADVQNLVTQLASARTGLAAAIAAVPPAPAAAAPVAATPADQAPATSAPAPDASAPAPATATDPAPAAPTDQPPATS